MMLTAGSCILSALYCLLCGRSQKLIIISFSMFISPEEFKCRLLPIFEVILGQNSPNVFGMLYLTPCCIKNNPDRDVIFFESFGSVNHDEIMIPSHDPMRIPLLVVKSSESQ